jgi:hypothetical protein
MPDMTLGEIVLGLVAALGAGGSGIALARRKPAPGTPEDHEQRLAEIERRNHNLETRMSHTENVVAQALGRMTESNDRLWKAVEKLDETLDGMRASLVRVDVEATVERELRKRDRRDTDPEKPR